MKAIAKRAKGFFVGTLLAALVFSSCGGFFDDVSAADSSPTYAPSAAGNSAPVYYAISIDQSIEHGSVAANTASANPASKAVEGETVTLAASPADGYALASLTYTPKGGSPINVGGNGNSRTFTMPKSDVSVSAEFTAIAYSVNVADSITGGTVSATPTNANAGQTISLTAASGAGWKLKAWDVKDEAGNPVTVANDAFDMPNGNVSVSAVFVKIDYSITISDTTNGRVSADKTTANYGDAVTLTITPADGYALAALTYALRGEEPVNVTGSGSRRSFEMPAGDVTVAATFAPVAFSVNVADSITGGRISATPTNANVDQTISLTAVADTGWKLKAWNVVAQGGGTVTVANNKFTMPAKNVSVSATFEKINYTVTVLQSANGTLSADKTTANYGEPVTLTARPADGYAFETLVCAPQGGSPEYIEGSGDTRTLSMPAANVTVSATFTPIAFSVNVADSITGGRIAASSTNANVGDVITLVPTANTGWQFKAWNVVAEGGATVAVTENQFTMPAKSVSVSAAFEKINYSITVEEAENGSVRADKATANYGDTVTIDLAAKDGYEFESVSVKDSDGHEVGTSALLDGEKYKFTMPAQNVTVEATFAAMEPLKVPLTLEAVEANAKVTFKNMAAGPVTYKVNGGTAQTIASETTATITLGAVGDKVAFYGDNATYTKNSEYSNISCDKNCYIYGNIMSLVKSKSFASDVELKERNTFRELFKDNRCITNKPGAELLLPATTLAECCYYRMFRVCTNLTSAPELPATTLAESCYGSMFQGCTNLTSAPELPATTLAESCYASMFHVCTNLTSAPELPATTLAESCYGSMFQGCTSLTNAPALPATTLAESCYGSMFQGCTSLTNAPALPATTLANSCYKGMFSGCKSLTRAPVLPATALADSCYFWMFSGCTSLTTAPELPATVLTDFCYKAMFSGCSNLTSVPELPATTLKKDCYAGMFQDCTSLTSAPALLASTLAEACYANMFRGCTSLTSAPNLPVATLAERCCICMFSGCTSLTSAPELPATTLADKCYESMFSGCTGLTVAPALPATVLEKECYESMFSDCTSLTSSSALPATTLANKCYYHMFKGCTNLTSAPELPATTLVESCYDNMFGECTSLEIAPVLPAATLAGWCYTWMFKNCAKLKNVTCLATDISAENCVKDWLDGVASSGTFTKAADIAVGSTNGWQKNSGSGIPSGWTVKDEGWQYPHSITIADNIAHGTVEASVTSAVVGTSVTLTIRPDDGYKLDTLTVKDASGATIATSVTGDSRTFTMPASSVTVSATFVIMSALETPLTLEAIEAGTIVTFKNMATEPVTYKVNGGSVKTIESEATEKITLVAVGDKVSFYGDNSHYDTSTPSRTRFSNIACDNKCYVYGNIMSLVKSDGFESVIELPLGNTFKKLFLGNSYITNKSGAELLLPAKTLQAECYRHMFDGCASLTTAPELPATMLRSGCYQNMFSGCTSLTSAPELPATTLVQSCYGGMFSGCTSLTSAPGLPATTLAENCYESMFSDCTSLTSAPELPATTMDNGCYAGMFRGCTSLTSAPELPAQKLAKSCYSGMFNRCTSLTSAPALPATKLYESCYRAMFGGCTSLTSAPELPATTLEWKFYGNFFYAEHCYCDMFRGCTSLTSAPPELPATTLVSYCYDGMFQDCTSLTSAPLLPATTLENSCYYNMFRGCTSLTSAPALPAETLAYRCYCEMFRGCTSLTSAPELPATTLAERCYAGMFLGCTSLTSAPELPATTFVLGVNDGVIYSAKYCYYEMFSGCTSLTSTPVLPVATLVEGCYKEMFIYCRNLKTITCLARNTSAKDCVNDCFIGVASNGTFINATGETWVIGSTVGQALQWCGLPDGWTFKKYEP